MAKVYYNKNVQNFDNFSQFDKTLKLTQLNDETFTMKDKDGTSMVFEGEDFERTQKVVTGGTITSAEFVTKSGKILYTFDGLSVDAELIYKAFTFGKDPMRIIHGLMDGDDTVRGSAKNDSIWGFGGNDRLFGGAGNDFLYGHRGDDIMTGGKGADTFVFATGYDNDTVTDFDLTGSDHDFIRLDYYLYKGMTYSEVDGNVTLTLASGDSLTLTGVTQAQIEGKTQFFDFY